MSKGILDLNGHIVMHPRTWCDKHLFVHNIFEGIEIYF